MSILTSSPAADASTVVRDERIDEAAAQWSGRIDTDRSAARLTYRVTGTGDGPVATRIRAGVHEFVIDEPPALAGDDSAASPVEYALAALISCQVVVYRLYSRVLGIPFDTIDVRADGDLDAARLFGLDDEVRAGFTAVRLRVDLGGTEPEERYEELQRVVDEHCPVFDLFTNPTPVTTTVRKI